MNIGEGPLQLHRFVAQVAESLHRYSMTLPGQRVGVAVSGGADSVVLLHVLHQLAPVIGIELAVLHVNHQLRGAESDGDQQFVQDLAASLKLPMLVERVKLAEGNLEQEARNARRNFFLGCMAGHELDRIALGHTRSDQAETVLYRFLRGSGTAGLASMRPKTPEGLIRPLLQLGRDEMREYATEQGIVWREDSSNVDIRFARNRLRRQIMPLLRTEMNSNLESVLAGTASVAQSEEDYWNEQVAEIYSQIAKRTAAATFVRSDKLNAQHPALVRRLIRQCIVDVRGDLRSVDLSHVEAVMRICTSSHGHDRVMLPGVDAQRSFGMLRFSRPMVSPTESRSYRVNLSVGSFLQLPHRVGRISLDWESLERQDCANFELQPEVEVAYLDGDVLTEALAARPMYLRNWEPGDELQPVGRSHAYKLKALFQEFKIFLWERRHWPVLVLGGEIAWTRKFGCASRFAAADGASRRIRLVYQMVDAKFSLYESNGN